ncbi:MAG: hypothetical protein ACOYXR_04380 [Nitrospirota bacterium]
MQVDWGKWIADYYPRWTDRRWRACVTEIREQRRLSVEEFQYVVLGCGYYFHVHRPSADDVVSRLKQAINGLDGEDIAEFILNEQAIRRRVGKLGWEVGPDRVRLSSTPKRGPVVNPAPRIAALSVYAWIKRRRPETDPTGFVCAVYHALSGRGISDVTFGRMQKAAAAVHVLRYVPEERNVSAIEAWLGMLESRYKGFRRAEDEAKQAERASVTKPLEKDDIPNLYPISGMAAVVLRAVGVTVEPRRRADGRFLPRGQKLSHVVR